LWKRGKLRWLRWFGWKKPCFENYVEMVAGLPRNEQKMKIFCKSNKRSLASTNTLKTVKMQCNVEVESCSSSSNESTWSSRFVGKIRFPVRGLTRRS
jgi:hypothetical protein